MSQTGPSQEAGSIDPSQEKGEWKPPIGILTLKLTYMPNGKLKIEELGVITGEEVVQGKKVYKFCRVASLFYTLLKKLPDSRAEISKPYNDDTLDKSGKYSKDDGSRIEYKYLYSQDDMIEFVEKLNLYNCNKLLELLRDKYTVLKMDEHNKLILISSLEIVINKSFVKRR
jgi:hypothetical protein